MLDIDYKKLERKVKNELATHIFALLVDGFDLTQQEFSYFYPMRYWKNRIEQLVRSVTLDDNVIISDNQFGTMTRSLFDIMYKDNDWFFKNEDKPSKYVIDINARADLRLTNSPFATNN